MRVLIVRAGALGDVLLLRPAIWALRLAGHEPVLLAPRRTGQVLLGPGPSEVREILDLDGAWLTLALAGDSRAARALDGFGAALALTRSQELIRLLSKSIPRVITRDPLPDGIHASTWACEPLEPLGCRTPEVPPPDLVPTESEQNAARIGFPSPERVCLALHAGSGSASKNWPAQSFGVVARQLTAGDAWLLVQGPAESPNDPLSALAGAIVLAHLPARQLVAIFRRTDLFIGNDSGITHLAAASGAPVVALFGPTDPALWAPVGSRVEVLRSPSPKMIDLRVESVLSAARTWLAPGEGRNPEGR